MKRILTASLTLLVLVTTFLSPAAVFAGTAIEQIQIGAETTNPGGPTINSALATGINLFSILLGVAAVFMMMLGSYKYITSAGDGNKIASAKATIMYALIGAVLGVLSQVILRFVIGKAIVQ